MTVFVEDPLSRIVAVHWEEPPEPPDPGTGDGVCGQVLIHAPVGVGFGGAGIMVLKTDGVWLVARNDIPDQPPDQPYMLLNALAAYFYEPRDTLVWNTAGSFTAGFSGTSTTQFRINEYRNINIQRFAGLPDPDWRAFPPAQQTSLPGFLVIRSQLPDEIYPPFYTVEYLQSGKWLRHPYPGGGIQAHCEHETIGGLPPQPPDYVLDIKQQLPGSSSDPVVPPEGARLTRRNRIRRWT